MTDDKLKMPDRPTISEWFVVSNGTPVEVAMVRRSPGSDQGYRLAEVALPGGKTLMSGENIGGGGRPPIVFILGSDLEVTVNGQPKQLDFVFDTVRVTMRFMGVSKGHSEDKAMIRKLVRQLERSVEGYDASQKLRGETLALVDEARAMLEIKP